ncbi:F420-0:gamma-glutamyl ligase-like protein [Fervidicella metallireducens AeB]|uniref:F420-0:gamma-glutamyl ligase-like protein n=1 Tax=Fervidicella metallireducens AeB TaxID=1403537 RepID=A0A017RXY6_9CLOT|nr:coenzyme F420-0:L-glutamate ligase [Fervidicella metallireducens]EYE89618.1 F420-0:gamma-glutamyl ligase-like protein [Fervidicella metallireducens AeB]
MEYVANENKELTREVDDGIYQRIPVKTRVVMIGDVIEDVVYEYTKDILKEDDVVFISEKCVAISQGRAYKMSEIKPSRLAKFLSKFVYKSPYGIGLGIPETMHFAIKECGLIRILFAAFAAAICTKVFKIKGVFYRIAGEKAASIDGPTPGTLPPFNEYVVLGPKEPDKTAKKISDKIGARVCIVDINDLGGKVLGASHEDINRDKIVKILKDNPLGQGHQSTPIGIIRKIKE